MTTTVDTLLMLANLFGDLNSRIGKQLPGEDHIVGPNSFGRRAVHHVETPNRDLLLEFCEGAGLLIANTFMPGGPEDKVTYIEPGSTFLGDVTESGYNMLDLLLCDNALFANTSQIGRYNFTVYANDTSGNINNSGEGWFNISIPADVTAPVFNDNYTEPVPFFADRNQI